MPKSLTDFLADIKVRGTVKSARFDLIVKEKLAADLPLKTPGLGDLINAGIEGGIRGLLNSFSQSNPLTIRCENVHIPGIQILTQEYKTYGGLPPVSVPTSRVYDPIQCTFLVSRSFVEKQYFENWMHQITNFTTNNVGYYNTWCKDLQINVYDEANRDTVVVDTILSKLPGNTSQIVSTARQNAQGILGEHQPTKIYSVDILDAIPTRIEEIPLGWEESNELIKINVQFVYRQIRFNKTGSNLQFGHQNKTF